MTQTVEQRADWSRRLVARNKRLFDAARERPCSRCGGEFPAVCMDLHHREPESKVVAVARLVNTRRSVAVIEAEIAKCDVLCANCHRIVESEVACRS